ncbi:MAG TPA: T9SS type A sorting domain-containing protein [Flavobacteriales bacterium]|nr:T9SS type A sorting domain-containing protein [Flavobacteriales bacterium]
MVRPSLLTLLLLASVDLCAQTPGGVGTNLQLWLRAEGYTGGATWTDASGNGRNASKNGTVTNSTLYNFQNVPTGFTTANYFSVAHNNALNANNGAISVFAVGLPGAGTYAPFVAKTFNSAWDAGWVLATSDPNTDLGFTTENWTGSGTANVAKQSGVSTTIPYIASGFGNGASTNVVSVCSNGTTVSTNTSAKSTTNLELRVGHTHGVYGFDGGNIAEVLMYNADLTVGQRQQVWSYLALKYGITLNNGSTNYLSSASSTVWSTGTNAGYNNNIFGIARDNTSGLHQRQSVSINAGLQPVIANSTTLVSLNSSGTDIGTNNSFLIAGSDNGATTFSTAITGLTGLNARLGRIWKIQETGTVGTVTVAWPETDASVRLVVSGDATFNGSDVSYATTAITINSVAYRQASVDLTNGQFFTFAKNIIAPGGQWAGLSLWLSTDGSGVTPGNNAADWDDLSESKNPVETIGTRTLQLADAAHNFQPFFNNFTSANHFKDLNSSLAPQSTFQATEMTMFGVARINSLANDGRIMGIDDTDNSGNDPGLSVLDASADFHRTSTSAVNTASPVDASLNSSSVFSAYTSTTTLGMGMDGAYNTSAITTGGGMTGDILMIGYGNATINGALPGDLQEVIWYKRTQNATEIKQVESYLAIKHGITLGGNSGTSSTYNYLNSVATTIWDKSANSGYNNDIAGIGRDDASALNQKQSNSVNSTGSVTMGLGSIATSNAANSGTFSQDRSFLIWGHDGAAHNSVFNDATCFTNLPTGVEARILRKWKVQVTNFAQNVTVAFDQADLVGYSPVSNLRLLVDDNGTNWSNATVYSSATSTGGRVVFSNVSFSSGTPFFTLATSDFDNTPLPIELISFEGRTIDTVNELTWATASERNNDHFEVQRSVDGSRFEPIGEVPGAGDSQQVIHYALTDTDPINGLNYYRLKQVDRDGAAVHSQIIVLNNERAATPECVVMTLDTDGLFAFRCTVPAGATFELFTQTGQPLKVQRFGEHGSQEVDLRTFSSGIYFARITDGVSVKTYKLLRP